MSFGSGGFGGFGQNNNTAGSSSGFGGFGATNTNTSTGFGSGSTAFGANNNSSGGGLFGNNSSTGGFGSTGTSAFGSPANKPAFGAGASTGTGLFGNTANAAPTSTFGGFGAGSSGGFGQTNNNTTSTTGAFGGGLFGQQKPATATFGANTTAGTTGGGLFGSSSGGFGGGSSAFGATNNPGIGTDVGNPPGTAGTPFTATIEKEANNPTQSNSFQNILFMQPYKNFSAEELRLADYNQGRRYGGGTGGSAFGQGAFGSTPSTTGGFGSTTTGSTFGGGGGLFGNSQQSTGTGFGATNTGSAFGSNTGGFGAAKPAATTGLFGNNNTTTTGGSMFGGNTTSAFGASNTTTPAFGQTNTTTGGGLFGNTANNTAAKPATTFGGFGSTQNNTTGGGLFGNNSGASAFGATNTATNTGGGLFGNTNNQATTGGGLFGQPQPNTGTGFGAAAQSTGTGLFGNQQKPAATGMFGNSTATNTGGGLFGNANTGTTGSAFGATNTQNSGGMFGAAKPATTGTGLFGNSTLGQTNTTGGGLFGNTLGNTSQAQQPTQGGGLFGNQNNQAKPMFGATQNTGGGLFGNTNNQQQSSGLFGGSFGGANQQHQAPALGSSLFNNSQNAQPAQQGFSTSITDLSAYGAQSLFSNLPADQIHNPGPLATPLSGQAKAKSRSILPMYKLSPANATRFVTPQKRGFGFSYSTYGSPNSASSATSTPGGFGNSLLGGSINRGLSKSISASNLRRSINVEDSILLPGAFSSSTGPRLLGGTGSHKKLVINRELRSGDLFTSPSKDKLLGEPASTPRKLTKRVSFETPGGASENSSQDGPSAPQPNGSEDLARLVNGANGDKPTQSIETPDMTQVKGNELAIVHEEESNSGTPRASISRSSDGERAPGAYWMSPSKEEIEKMNRMQRQKVADFVVGRENVGSVSFKIPVDLSNIDLDHLYDEIVILEPRQATVYPNAAKKPPVGKGINVPAVISLEQSWPRGKDKKGSSHRLQKHIERLKKITDTKFESYDVESGIWTFSVEHFTTYGLDDEDDDEDETAVTGARESTRKDLVLHEEDVSPETDPDDTFQYKRSRKSLPGAFEEGAVSDDEEDSSYEQEQQREHRAATPSSDEADPNETSYDYGEDERMAEVAEFESDAGEGDLVEDQAEDQDEFALSRSLGPDRQVPAGIMRARMRALRKSVAPTKIEVAGGNNWTQILQESVRAPRTVDRVTLRALNESGVAWDAKDRGSPEPKNRDVGEGEGFANSIDLMKSLFQQSKGPAPAAQAGSSAKGFVKWPYQRTNKVDKPQDIPVPRPRWGPNGALVTVNGRGIAIHHVETGSTKLSDNAQLELMLFLADSTKRSSIGFRSPGRMTQGDAIRSALPEEEAYGGDAKWQLARILTQSKSRDRFLPFSNFWQELLSEATTQALSRASSLEEKAIISLAGNQIDQACEFLLSAGNFRLASLVACIGTQAKDIRTQVKDWRDAMVLSEFSDPIRALYELLGGNACMCAGAKGVPLENRVESFVISEHFGLSWMQAFGLRLFCTPCTTVEEAVLSFQADVDQGKESYPEGDPLWDILKLFAHRKFDWAAVDRIGWLLTLVLTENNAYGNIDFGPQARAEMDRAILSFASTLHPSNWDHATVVLGFLHQGRESALLDYLGRHAHLLGYPQGDKMSVFLDKFVGNRIPAKCVWEAKALYFRYQQDHMHEFLALLRAKCYEEANTTFLERLAPELVISRDYDALYRFAKLLHTIKHKIDWNKGTAAYLLFPMVRDASRDTPLDYKDHMLYDAMGRLRGNPRLVAVAALADMAEDLIKARGNDPRLYQLLPEDIRDRYFRDAVLA